MSNMRASSSARASAAVARHAVQRAVVDDVLARGQARVEAARVGQHAHARQHVARSRDDVDAVDAHRPGVGRDQRGEHAQRRRLAGAVRAEQAGDAAVRRVEADVATAWTRGALDGAVAVAGAGSERGTRASRRALGAGAANDLARPRTSIIAPASVLTRPRPRPAGRRAAAARRSRSRRRPRARRGRSLASMKRNTTSRMQPMPSTPWPALATTTWRAIGPERADDALAVARRRRRVDAAAQHQHRRGRRGQRVERRRHVAARPAPRTAARRSARTRGRSRRPACRRSARRRGTSSAQTTDRCMPVASRVALRDGEGRVQADQAGELAARRRRRSPRGSAAASARHVERAAHRAEQHVARQDELLGCARSADAPP